MAKRKNKYKAQVGNSFLTVKAVDREGAYNNLKRYNSELKKSDVKQVKGRPVMVNLNKKKLQAEAEKAKNEAIKKQRSAKKKQKNSK